jgi:acetylornithine deacetylase/succinyl-diaminopimelate desuccinylase-like protein
MLKLATRIREPYGPPSPPATGAAARTGGRPLANRSDRRITLRGVTAERDYVEANRESMHADLDAWLRIPSISADPAHAPDVRASAEWLASAFRRDGFPTVEIWDAGGAPAVFAEWPAAEPDAPVVVVYGHHDVQPVDPLEKWVTPPFEPTIRGEELFARGAADDKGQLLFHLLGLRAHLAATGRDTPAVTLRFLIEGEEESGSPHFADLLTERKDRLAPDVTVVTDTGLFARDFPTTTTGLRGLAGCQIDFHGPDVDLHSGSFGGAVANPLTALAGLLAALHDEDGRVAIPGFYDQVVPLADEERARFAELPFDEQEWLTGPAKSRAAVGEAGFSTLERVGARPTAEVNGMWGGYNGPGHKTIVPSDAHAKLSFRLVPDQRGADLEPLVRKFVEEHTPPGITATVDWEGDGVAPLVTPLGSPALDALVRAMEKAFGQPVGFVREGGSGPEADLATILGAPVVFLGVGLPDDAIHSPNERVVLPMLERGAEAAAYLWSELASPGPHPARS